MTAIKYIEAIKQDILDMLIERPLTITDLKERLDLPYSTVHQAHQLLRDEGKIIKMDRRHRGARWTVGPNNGPKSIIPSVRWNNSDVKMTDFKTTTVVAYPGDYLKLLKDIFYLWPRIAQVASHLHEGTPNDILVKRLEARKIELTKARSALENLIFYINQVLEQPKLWDPNYLTQFPEDKDWAEFYPHLQQMLELINKDNA